MSNYQKLLDAMEASLSPLQNVTFSGVEGKQQVNQPVNQPVNQQLNHQVNQPVNHQVNHQVNQPVNHQVNQPVNQPVNQQESSNDLRKQIVTSWKKRYPMDYEEIGRSSSASPEMMDSNIGSGAISRSDTLLNAESHNIGWMEGSENNASNNSRKIPNNTSSGDIEFPNSPVIEKMERRIVSDAIEAKNRQILSQHGTFVQQQQQQQIQQSLNLNSQVWQDNSNSASTVNAGPGFRSSSSPRQDASVSPLDYVNIVNSYHQGNYSTGDDFISPSMEIFRKNPVNTPVSPGKQITSFDNNVNMGVVLPLATTTAMTASTTATTSSSNSNAGQVSKKKLMEDHIIQVKRQISGLGKSGEANEDTSAQFNDNTTDIGNNNNSNPDPDAGKLNQSLEKWTDVLKKTILSDFLDAKHELLTKQNSILQNEKKAYQKQLAESYRNMEGLKEEYLRAQAELQRQATLIDTLSATKYGRLDVKMVANIFTIWRSKIREQRYEKLLNLWAENHHLSRVCRSVLHGWARVCLSSKVEQVEQRLRQDQQSVLEESQKPLQAEISQLRSEKEALQGEIERLMALKAKQEETVKQAFLRGVCALNLEAMQMFHLTEEEKPPTTTATTTNFIDQNVAIDQICNNSNNQFDDPLNQNTLYRQPPTSFYQQNNATTTAKTMTSSKIALKPTTTNSSYLPPKVTSQKPKTTNNNNNNNNINNNNFAKNIRLKQGVPTNPGKSYDSVSSISSQRIGKTTVQVTRHYPSSSGDASTTPNSHSHSHSHNKWSASNKVDI